MKSITKPSLLENLGGLLRVWAIPPEVILITGRTIAISSQTNVIKLYCIEDTANFTREKKKDNGNDYYDVIVSGVTLCKTSADEEILQELEQKKWVVIFEDGNNLFKIAGTPTERLTFLSDEDSGKSTSDRNQVFFKFIGKIIARPFFITDPF